MSCGNKIVSNSFKLFQIVSEDIVYGYEFMRILPLYRAILHCSLNYSKITSELIRTSFIELKVNTSEVNLNIVWN